MSQTLRTTHFIDGQWSPTGGRTFADNNPYNGEKVFDIAAGTRADADRAVAAAAKAFPAWAALPPIEKQRLFLKTADIIDRRLPEIVRAMAIENGACHTYAGFQVKWSSHLLRQVSGWGYLPAGEYLPCDTPGRFAMALRKPMGVVAGFTPWNGAFSLAWRTIALPMAFGNTVVIKPSEFAPVTAGLLHAEIMEEAGFPAGAMNVVAHAPGEAGAIADAFFESPAVRCINFTGSAATARMLGERAGRALKRTVFELGGYNPMIVLADADLDYAVDTAAFGAFFHQGQICMNTRKVYVERAIHDDFVKRLVAKTRTIKCGDPLDPANHVGPLISDRAIQQCHERIKDSVGRGGKIMIGGTADGRVFAPTILTNVPSDAIAACGAEETFGPVLIIEAVDDGEQALARAQDTPYGLSASIMTGNQDRGLDMARRFDSGIIHVNGATMASEPSLPNGGVKDSGWGRSGHYAVEDFTEVRLTTLNHGRARYPF